MEKEIKKEKMKMTKTRSKGFTLIELLVVIAIIAILAAILFPVFARARENARRASCQSNVKQIALGIFMYNQDYDEKLPRVSVNDDNVTSSNPFGWADALQPYLKSEQIFQCPSEPTAASTSSTTATRVQNRGYSDYWINGDAAGKSDANFDAPAMTALLGDGEGKSGTVDGTNYTNLRGSARYRSSQGECENEVKVASFHGANRHLDGANIAFADGHVKWMKGNGAGAGTDTSAPASAQLYNRCTGTNEGFATMSIDSTTQAR